MRHDTPCHEGPIAARGLHGPRAMLLLGWLVLLQFPPAAAFGQALNSGHYWLNAESPPGLLAQMRVARGGPVAGYPQPVELRGPGGAHVSFAAENRFLPPQSMPVKAGLLIGPVYRFRVSHIPLHEGLAVFPTVEMLDRLYPPAGQEVRFPVVVEITMDDIRLALQGKYVTRVIYVEPPQQALPVRGDLGGQGWFDVRPENDPLAVADSMGRPIAILRIGGRVPTGDDGVMDSNFLFGCPPLLVLGENEPTAGAAPGEATRMAARPMDSRNEPRAPGPLAPVAPNPLFRGRPETSAASPVVSPWTRTTY